MDDPRRAVPRTDLVLSDPSLQAATRRVGERLVKSAAVAALARCRAGEIPPEGVTADALRRLPVVASGLRRVINATGVVVHTNLGRAPLSRAAVEAVEVAAGATDLELDLATGRRGPRGSAAMSALADAVPDAEEVHVVNNGAAALALTAAALAAGKEIVVARGELVEIGDGFRIPELLESTGAARLREVGTTNRVRLEDYAAAIGPETGFLLKVHPSNFVVTGFTSSVEVAALCSLAAPVVADIGSGLLAPHPRLPDEPDAASALRAGAAIVTASGDKLLGGPQSGLVLGRADLVRRVRRHPLARGMRVDKLTLAALEATLTGPLVPVAASLAVTRESLDARAVTLRRELLDVVPVEIVETDAVVGGGGAPGVALPSVALVLPPELGPVLREGEPAVLGHLDHGRLLLDLIAVDPADDLALAEAVRRAAKG